MSVREEVITINEKTKPNRKIVCIADGSICTPVKHTGFFTWFNCCFYPMQQKEIPKFRNSLPQQIYEELDESEGIIVKHYIPGCGSNGGFNTFYDLLTGWEVPHILIKILTFLGNNYDEGSDDEICLVGFSRGGYATTLAIKFLQFFSRHNEGRCLPTGLKIWNHVTPKKLVYDLTYDRKDHLLKTFTRNQLQNDFKMMPIKSIRFVSLLDVVPQYTNQAMICDPCCTCSSFEYCLPVRRMKIPAEKVFKNVQKVVHVVPLTKVDILCPCPDIIFELFPSSVITKTRKTAKPTKTKAKRHPKKQKVINSSSPEEGVNLITETIDSISSDVNVDQYFLKNENHITLSNNVEAVEILNREITRAGLKLKNRLVSNDTNPSRDMFYCFYGLLPLYLLKEKKIKRNFVHTQLTFFEDEFSMPDEKVRNIRPKRKSKPEEEEEEEEIKDPIE